MFKFIRFPKSFLIKERNINYSLISLIRPKLINNKPDKVFFQHQVFILNHEDFQNPLTQNFAYSF
jgi:hypothetical protein